MYVMFEPQNRDKALILIVDDDETIRDLMSASLEDSGYEVAGKRQAGSGAV
jgi:CheY-like chemotaxis protein